MKISMRTSALLGLAILFRVSPLCYWLSQSLGTWVTPHENLDSPRFNDYYLRTVPVMSPSEP